MPFLIMVAGLILIATFVFLIEWKMNWSSGCTGKITYKQFRNMMVINEDGWDMRDGFVQYTYATGFNSFWGTTDHQTINLYFSPIDTLRYILYKRNKDRIEERNRRNSEMKNAIEHWQQDIENYKEKYVKKGNEDNG